MLALRYRSRSRGSWDFHRPLELQLQISRRLKTLVGVFCQTSADGVLEHYWNIRLNRAHRLQVVFENCRRDFELRFALESPLSGCQFVENCAEGKNIAARVGLFPFDLFWRHVLNGAEDRTLGGQRRDRTGARDRGGC